MKSVVCYVPGSGGVKLCRLLAEHATVNDFEYMHHWHQSNNIKKGPGRFSLNSRINDMMSTRTNVSINSGDTIGGTVFLYLDQHENLVDSLQRPIGAYFGNNRYTTSHCMRDHVARQRYPDRFHVKILCDIHLALRRWWRVYARDQALQTPPVTERYRAIVERLGSDQQRIIAGFIIMHLEYYRDFYDVSADYVINIHCGDDEFSEFMRRDLELCQDRDFDHVWESLVQDPNLQTIWQTLSDKIT